jgi:hypothetical protein
MSRWFRNVTEPLRTLERITRPPRQVWADLDTPLTEAEDDDPDTCYFCGEPTENIVDTDHGAEYVCGKCCEPGEPLLTDDEVVAVRQLIEDRFGDQTDPSPGSTDSPAGGATPPTSPAGPSTFDRKHEPPWHVEDFTDLPWVDGMQFGISNRWHEVIIHCDTRVLAQTIVDSVNGSAQSSCAAAPEAEA